jgi:hypothetical protein
MKWMRVELANEVSLPDVPGLKAALVQINSRDGRRREVLRIGSVEWSVDLDDAADTSQGPSKKAAYVVVSESRDRLFLFGGTMAHRLSMDGRIESQFRLNRDPIDEEYWTTKFHTCDEGLLVEYEGGLFLLEESLEVLWHRNKAYNDQVEGLRDGLVHMVADHTRNWSLSLKTGDRVGQDPGLSEV